MSKDFLYRKSLFHPSQSQFIARAKTGATRGRKPLLVEKLQPCGWPGHTWGKNCSLLLTLKLKTALQVYAVAPVQTSRDASESQVALSANTSLDMPGMSAECRTAVGEANFIESEHSVITNNAGLDNFVCFRTWKGHGLEARRREEIRFHKQALHFTKQRAAQSWDLLYLIGKMKKDV